MKPWEQFAAPAAPAPQPTQPEQGPWSQFSTPARPGPTIEAARADIARLGIDFNGPEQEVRQKIAALPENKRKAATDVWAKTYVANEVATGKIKGSEKDNDNVLRAVARGTPVGSWLDEANAATYGIGNKLGLTDKTYDEVLAYNRARDEQFDKANTKTSLGLKVAGGLLSARAAPAITAMRGTTIAPKFVNGLLTGGVYGAIYGAGEGEDLKTRATDAAKGAAIGAGIGAAVPIVATGGANTWKYLADKARPVPPPLGNYHPGAVDRVSEGMRDAGLNAAPAFARPGAPQFPAYAEQTRRLGSEGMIADMGENMSSHVRGIARNPGGGQEIMTRALRNRANGAGERIAQDTDQVLGPARNLVQVEEAVTENARRAAKPFYDKFYATEIPQTEALTAVMARVPESVLSQARKLAKMEGFDLREAVNTGRGLDVVKRAIDDMAQRAKQSGDSNLHRITSNLARDLRNVTDDILSPGAPADSVWSQGRRLAGDGLQFKEALEEGGKAFSKNVHPDRMAADLAAMNPLQQAAYREGSRGQVRDIMGNAATRWGANPDTAAERALGSEYARKKLRLITDSKVPGRAPPEQLIARLEAETQFAKTAEAAYGGSMTGNNVMAQAMYPAAGGQKAWAREVGRMGMGGIPTYIAARVLNAATLGHMDAKNMAIAADAARLLTAQGTSRDAIANALLKHGTSRAMSDQMKQRLAAAGEVLLNAPRQVIIDMMNDTSSAPAFARPKR